MERRCSNCAFFDRYRRGDGKSGDCRLNPPKVMQSVQQGEQYYTQFENVLPCVHETEWCGQHKTDGEFHGV